MSYRGEARFHCERTGEDPKFYARDPQLEDTSAEDRAVEAEPDYFAEAVEVARLRASQIPNVAQALELCSCLDRIERLHRESLR